MTPYREYKGLRIYAENLTVADWWKFTIDIRARFYASDDAEEQKRFLIRAQVWCDRFVDNPSAEVATWFTLNGIGSPFQLGLVIIDDAGIDGGRIEALQEFSDRLTDAKEYDEEKDKVCECRKCSGVSDDESECLLVSDPVTNQLYRDADLINEFWDRPYSLYQVAKVRRRTATRALAGGRQKREREKEEAAEKKSRSDSIIDQKLAEYGK